MKLFMKHAVITVGLIWLSIFALSSWIDSLCIEGRLSHEQSMAINSQPWDKCPDYNEGHCEADEEDRVFRRECSEVSKIFFGDPIRGAIKDLFR